MPRARIGYVGYLNTLPLIEGLQACRDVEAVGAPPSRLIGMLAAGHVDVALVSVVDFARSPVPLAMLPVGMIGCDGPTMTVRLYSATPIQHLTTVHADAESHTSVVLMQVLLWHRLGRMIETREFDAAARAREPAAPDQWPEAVLLIGDKVVRDCPPADARPHQMDLGLAWKELTGLPFVYAVWMCRAEDAASPAVHAVAALLDRQRCRNRMRLDWIVRSRAAAHWWPRQRAETYIGRLIRYEVGQRERMAVARFLAEAADLGLAPRREPVWVSTNSPRSAPRAGLVPDQVPNGAAGPA